MQLEVKEIIIPVLSRTSTDFQLDFPVLEFFPPILARTFQDF
jgi:hypothetical protein